MSIINPEVVGQRLTWLRSKHSVSTKQICEIADINSLTLRKYETGAFSVGTHNGMLPPLVNLADFYGVSIDWILGRCEMDEEKYALDVKKLYEKSYEKYLVYSKKQNQPWELVDYYMSSLSSHINTPGWPYTLIDAINDLTGDEAVTDGLIPTPVSDEVKANLMWVIDHELKEREAVVVKHIYIDEWSLDETGKALNIGRERVRQIAAKAIRKLRHPARIKYILVGKKEAELNNRIFEAKMTIQKKEKELRELQLVIADLERNGLESEFCDKVDIDDITLEELDFSVRTYNCLKRKGITTAMQVRAAILDGSIVFTRNLGRKSLDEVMRKIIMLYGEFTVEEVDEFNDVVLPVYLQFKGEQRCDKFKGVV